MYERGYNCNFVHYCKCLVLCAVAPHARTRVNMHNARERFIYSHDAKRLAANNVLRRDVTCKHPTTSELKSKYFPLYIILIHNSRISLDHTIRALFIISSFRPETRLLRVHGETKLKGGLNQCCLGPAARRGDCCKTRTK